MTTTPPPTDAIRTVLAGWYSQSGIPRDVLGVAFAQLDALEAENASQRALICEVALSGVEYEHPRLKYLVVQIDREVWDNVQQAAGAARTAPAAGVTP